MWVIALISSFGMSFVVNYYQENPVGEYINVMGQTAPGWVYLIVGIIGLVQAFGTISLIVGIAFFAIELSAGRVSSRISEQMEDGAPLSARDIYDGDLDVYAPVAASAPALTVR